MPKSLSKLPALVIMLAIVTPLCYAQAEAWRTQIEANLGINQSQYSNNWHGSEASGFAWTSNLNALTQKQLNANFHWKHTLKLAFGQTHNQDRFTKDWFEPVKSNDLIDYETVLKFTRGWFVDPVISGRFESQFIDQSDPSNPRYINPMKFSEMIGVARTIIDQDKRFWDARLGIVYRQIVNDFNPNTISDGGIQFDTDFKTPLNDRLSFASRLTFTQALINSESDNLKGQVNEDYWRSLDVYWDNTLTGKLASFLSVHLNAQLLYDKEIALGGRFKQTLSLGLTYIFNSQS